jgi:hypothetical protein
VEQMVMYRLDNGNKKNLISGRWGNSYTFTSKTEKNVLSVLIKDNSGTIIAKWNGKWVVKPFSPKEQKAARDILEFLYYRNSVSQLMKTIG